MKNSTKLAMLGAFLMVTMAFRSGASAFVTEIQDPDSYACSGGFIGFEEFNDQFNLADETIQGVRFTTTGGYTWLVGDFSTGFYNGKYPSGQYTSQGEKWAWLGPNQGEGRIDFKNGPASTFSVLVSSQTPVYLEAYDSNDTLLDSAGPSLTNTSTGSMAELKIVRGLKDIAYVIVHDSGNYFLVDSICTDAPGVNVNTKPVAVSAGPYLGAVNTDIVLDASASYDADGDSLSYFWTVEAGCLLSDNASEFPTVVCDSAGTFEATLIVNDGKEDSAPSKTIIVVYDPSAGFVTGGGWIMSPVGAFAANPLLTGKANFGFVSKYQKGKSIPSGNTEFQFNAGGLNFSSTFYDWLVITGGNKAQFKGEGTINGSGIFGFMLTANDANPDSLRIRIWDKNNGDAIVYDNMNEQAIVGGSIKVQSK